MVIVISIGMLIRIVLCAMVLTALTVLSRLESTDTSDGDNTPAQQGDSVVVEAGG